jgi:hypothetical protein
MLGMPKFIPVNNRDKRKDQDKKKFLSFLLCNVWYSRVGRTRKEPVMQHPLVNPSLTPYGFVFPGWAKRLEFQPNDNSYWVNTEVVIGTFWAERNRLKAPRPLPVQTIIHHILPGMAAANRLTTGDFVFDGLPYLSRDIATLSSAVQWFGTNVGRCFLEDVWPHIPAHRHDHEFLAKLEYEREKSYSPTDLAVHFTHTCNERCGKIVAFWGSCKYIPSETTLRDRAVVDGLMRWLGRKDGREFIADYQARRKRVQSAASERRRRDLEAQRTKKAA